MATLEIVVPAELNGAQECLLVTWLKQTGDPVKPADPLVILQAEKVSFEVPAPAGGVMGQILANQGDVVVSGQLLAHLEVEVLPQQPAGPPAGVATTASPTEPEREVRASPIAKRMAKEHGIDLAQVAGTGDGGRITEKDVQAAIDVPAAAPLVPPPTPVAVSPGQPVKRAEEGRVVPMAGMRQAIARRMHESLQSTAQLTLHTEADVTDLVALRQRLKVDNPVTYTDFVVRASARALRQQPGINVTLVGDTLHYQPDIHIGLAVALDNGLVVPVIRHADRKSLAELAQERVRLAARARAGQLTSEEMSGGTFTITNLGGYGIAWFTPILNLPEAAILGVGQVGEKIVVHQGRIAQRWMVGLSLTIDHRLIDGAPGAAFLQAIQTWLESPEQLD